MRTCSEKNTRTAALAIAVLLVLITASCLLYLLLTDRRQGACTAEIYQNGRLIRVIPLDQVQKAYSFDVVGQGGCINRIEVRPGKIGVIWADCPDRLCVEQGFAESPVIPITCLPNRLVIRLKVEDALPADTAVPDAVTY